MLSKLLKNKDFITNLSNLDLDKLMCSNPWLSFNDSTPMLEQSIEVKTISHLVVQGELVRFNHEQFVYHFDLQVKDNDKYQKWLANLKDVDDCLLFWITKGNMFGFIEFDNLISYRII